MNPLYKEVLLAFLMFGSLIAAFYFGRRFGRISDEELSHLGAIQGATLGLIGLLLGFCLSGAINRFVDRQDLLVSEANAIGTSWLRVDLLEEPIRVSIRERLRDFTVERLKLFEVIEDEEVAKINANLDRLQKEIWSAAIRGVEARPATMMSVLPPINEMFDLLSTRNAAARRHLPPLALTLVFSSALLGSLLLGYGMRGKRLSIRAAAMAVVLILGGIVWTTIDIDFPQRGLLQLNVEPLNAVLKSMTP